MRKKIIGSTTFVMVIMALAAVLVLTGRADRQASSILVGVPNGAGESSLAADFSLSEPLKSEQERNTVLYAMLNAEHSEADPETLGEADAVIQMNAEGRAEAPFQYGAFLWLTEDEVLLKTNAGELRSITGPNGQALAELVREQIAPYARPRTD